MPAEKKDPTELEHAQALIDAVVRQRDEALTRLAQAEAAVVLTTRQRDHYFAELQRQDDARPGVGD